MKYILIITLLYFFWDSEFFWSGFLVLLMLSLLLHFWYRYKTAGWSRSYGLWKHEKERSDEHAAIENKEDETV